MTYYLISLDMTHYLMLFDMTYYLISLDMTCYHKIFYMIDVASRLTCNFSKGRCDALLLFYPSMLKGMRLLTKSSYII